MRAHGRDTGAAAAATVATTAAPLPALQLTLRQGLPATPDPGQGGPSQAMYTIECSVAQHQL